MDLDRLLRFGYFPKELPPPFTTKGFADFAKNELFPTISRRYVTKPCLHNLARPGNQRRVLSIPNPFNYHQICNLLQTHKKEVEEKFEASKLSTSIPKYDEFDNRAYVPTSEGNTLVFQRAKVRAGSKYVLRADVSRFYYSIYTHSIPWALKGKAWAKNHRAGGFGNDLDLFLRNAQDTQTLGIPVGPDASLIVSEIIACAIDEVLQAKRLRGFRFVDDFEFTFRTRSEAEKGLPVLEGVLKDFELALNPSKVTIDELPVFLEQAWRRKILGFTLKGEKISPSRLIEYFDLLFELRSDFKNEAVLKYGISRLKSCEFQDTDVLVNLLFQCIPIEAGTLKEALALIEQKNIPFKKSALAQIINQLIYYHGALKHGSEVAWALWAAIYYSVRITNQAIAQLEGFDDSVIALLALHASDQNLTSIRIDRFWRHLARPSSLKDGNWLLAYEAKQKGWMPLGDLLTDRIDTEGYFKRLLENDVSFYRTDFDSFAGSDESDEYGNFDSDGDGDTGLSDLDPSEESGTDLPF